MKVDDALVERLAHLSRLEFEHGAKDKMKADFEKILHFVDQLEKVNTDGVDPLVYMSDASNVLRKDKVEAELSQSEALHNAPKKDTDYIRVPKVIKS